MTTIQLKMCDIQGRLFELSADNNYGSAHFVSCAMPIMSEGDIIGCVASLCPMNGERGAEQTASDIESKLVLTAAGFLGKQLEG